MKQKAVDFSIIVISRITVKDKAHDCPALQPLVQQMIAAFERAAGARVCARIKPVQFDEQVRCLSTVNMAADILEQLIGERNETAALM